MLVILVKDLATDEGMNDHPAASLLWHPPGDTPPIDIAAIPSNLGSQNLDMNEHGDQLVKVHVNSTVVFAEPQQACSELVGPNHDQEYWKAKVVLVDRGGCTFVVKMHYAQEAGASAVIVRNTVAGEGPIVMVAGMHVSLHNYTNRIGVQGPDPGHAAWEAQLTIPSVMVSSDHGNMLSDNLGTVVTLEITPPPTSPDKSNS